METKNLIGLDSEKAVALTEKLNILLANFQLFYINARGFHWNITGQQFLNSMLNLKNYIMIPL